MRRVALLTGSNSLSRPKDFKRTMNHPISGSSPHWACNISQDLNRYFQGPVASQTFDAPSKSIEEVDAYMCDLLETQLGWSRDGIIMLLHSKIEGGLNGLQQSLEWILSRYCTQFLCSRTALEAYQLFSVRYAENKASVSKEAFLEAE